MDEGAEEGVGPGGDVGGAVVGWEVFGTGVGAVVEEFFVGFLEEGFGGLVAGVFELVVVAFEVDAEGEVSGELEGAEGAVEGGVDAAGEAFGVDVEAFGGVDDDEEVGEGWEAVWGGEEGAEGLEGEGDGEGVGLEVSEGAAEDAGGAVGGAGVGGVGGGFAWGVALSDEVGGLVGGFGVVGEVFDDGAGGGGEEAFVAFGGEEEGGGVVEEVGEGVAGEEVEVGVSGGGEEELLFLAVEVLEEGAGWGEAGENFNNQDAAVMYARAWCAGPGAFARRHSPAPRLPL
ncbi:hypothetical protein [Methanopyrus sp.]